MKTKEELNAVNEKKIEAMIDTFDELTDEEIAQVIGGGMAQIDENDLLTFNGKYQNNGARTCKGKATANVMFTEQMGASTTATSTLTKLMDRNGKAMGIEDTDNVTMSFVKGG